MKEELRDPLDLLNNKVGKVVRGVTLVIALNRGTITLDTWANAMFKIASFLYRHMRPPLKITQLRPCK